MNKKKQERKCDMRVLWGYAQSHDTERETNKQPCDKENKQTKSDNLIEEMKVIHNIILELD